MRAIAVVVFLVSLSVGAACGATSGPNAGELMFDMGSDDDDAGIDAGRQPLALDGGQ